MAEKLTEQQLAAVTDRGGQLLVSAAAGSGKTKVLVERLMRYLTDPVDPANVDDFLIITYTKAAAAELRGKIAQELSQRIAEEPENRHLQQQIQRLYLAKISTVHAFCADILRENAYRLDLSADFRVADENECVQLQVQALEQILNDIYAQIDCHEEFRSLIDTQGFGRDDRMIPQIILKVYHSAKCHLDPEGWLDWCADQSMAEGISDAAQTVWGQYLVTDLHRFLDLNIQALSDCAQRASDNDTMQKPYLLLTQTVEQLESLRSCTTWDQIVAHQPVDFGRLTFSKKCTDTHLAEQIKAIREACKTGLSSKMRGFTDSSEQVLSDLRKTSASACGLIALVRQFSSQYDLLKSRRRVLDFADLEHRTLDLLLGKKRTGITVAAKEIGLRFREIMVDEYQDSNGVQDAIFSVLTDQRQNCFMVGDVKQSIYQFRLADPGIFLKKYDTFVPADQATDKVGRKILLSKNFRSSAGVIQAVNDVFSKCMSTQVGGLEYTDNEMLYEGIPHVPLGEPEVELHGIQVQEDTYEEEAAFVADRVCQLLDGQHMIRQADTLRPIRAEDIVILLRSPGSVGAEFQFALQKRGIRCSNGDSLDLQRTEEVSVLISLLQTITNPQQDIPLLAVLTSRLFGFTADEMALIRGKNKYCSLYDALLADKSEKTCRFLQMLKVFRLESQRLKLAELLESIFTKTGLLSAYLSVPDGETKCANLKAFLQVASDFSNSGQRDLIQFLDYLRSMEERGLVVTTEQKNADTVSIMSIHKSKGLEFPVVFLCGLSRSFNKDSAREQVLCHKDLGLGLSFVDLEKRVRYPSIAKRAIAAKITEEGISEELRVLYVAMTRPRDRLIMTYAKRSLASDLQEKAMRLQLSPKDLLTGQVDCPGDWILQTALTRTEAGAFFELGGDPGCTEVSSAPWLIRVTEGVVSKAGHCEDASEPDPLSPEWIARMKQTLQFSYEHKQATMIPSKQTATQLKGRAKDQEIAENAPKKRNASFRRPSFVKPAVSGKDYGTAVHAFMQYADFSACDSLSTVKQEVARLASVQLITNEQAEMIDPNSIAALFSSQFGKRLREHPHVIREFKFSVLADAQKYYPDVVGEQILLQGVVDCALIDPDGITVIDFKTDRVTESTVGDAVKKYLPQVQTYQYALQKIYNLPVKQTCLYFFRIGKLVNL